MLFAGVNNRIQATEIELNPGGGITDTAVQPIGLGWHFPRADAIAGYTIFVPTGRYTDGADDNTGLGMWGHELAVGTTVYLNAARQYHAATMATFDFQSKKEDSETKVGNQMNLEGGIGGDFLKGRLTVGLSYYAAFKLTDDVIDGLPSVLIRGKNKVFALGPEVSLALRRAACSTVSSKRTTSGRRTRAPRRRAAHSISSRPSRSSQSSCRHRDRGSLILRNGMNHKGAQRCRRSSRTF